MAYHWFRKTKALGLSALALVLALVVACGSAAAPANTGPAPTAVVVEKIVERIVEVEVEKEVIREVTRDVFREVVVTPTPIPAAPAEAVVTKVERVVYAFGELQETNRHWTVSRPSYYQFDPYAETLLDLEPTTNARIPRLAESWESSPDLKSWTFKLVEGVPFHDGWGEVTTADVVNVIERQTGDDAGGGATVFLEALDEVEVVDDYTITFHMKSSTTLWPAMASRGFGGGELLILSDAQLKKEGVEGIDEKPAGTGPYEYGGRTVGESIWFKRIQGDHWRGERPDFKEIEIRWVREEATRLAMLLVGESHISSLSRELQFEAIKRGMKNISAQVPTNYLVMFFGGQYYADGDPAYDASVPWANPATGKLIRQAMNKAINRQEMLDFILRGSGSMMMNTAYHPTLEGWNDTWEDRFDEMYGYDPDAARELMRQAGYGPDNPMEFQIWNYSSSDEPETPVMVEALINYWEPIGVELKLVDSEWGTVRGYYRAQGDEIKKGGWGNVITMRSLVDRIRSWESVKGTGRGWETNLIDQAWVDIGKTSDLDEIDRLIGEVGNERFDNFADIPFFWFGLEVTVNPEVIEDWTFPGTAASKTSHWNLLKAAQ